MKYHIVCRRMIYTFENWKIQYRKKCFCCIFDTVLFCLENSQYRSFSPSLHILKCESSCDTLLTTTMLTKVMKTKRVKIIKRKNLKCNKNFVAFYLQHLFASSSVATLFSLIIYVIIDIYTANSCCTVKMAICAIANIKIDAHNENAISELHKHLSNRSSSDRVFFFIVFFFFSIQFSLALSLSGLFMLFTE